MFLECSPLGVQPSACLPAWVEHAGHLHVLAPLAGTVISARPEKNWHAPYLAPACPVAPRYGHAPPAQGACGLCPCARTRESCYSCSPMELQAMKQVRHDFNAAPHLQAEAPILAAAPMQPDPERMPRSTGLSSTQLLVQVQQSHACRAVRVPKAWCRIQQVQQCLHGSVLLFVSLCIFQQLRYY